jgi:CheY-like chemotaxis protein
MSPETAAESAMARILVIDDDPRIRRIIQRTLEEEGFVVETASDGQQGVARATSTCPTIIVLDLHLPVLDGAAVVDRLRAVYGEPPPTVLITADDRPEEQVRRTGAYAYLQKPFDLEDLVATVHRGLQMRPG